MITVICNYGVHRYAVRADNVDGVHCARHGRHSNEHLPAQGLDEASPALHPASVFHRSNFHVFVVVQLPTVSDPRHCRADAARGPTVDTRASTERFPALDREVPGTLAVSRRPRSRWSWTVADRRSAGRVAATCPRYRSLVLLDFLGDQRRIFDGHVHPHPDVVSLVAESPSLTGSDI